MSNDNSMLTFGEHLDVLRRMFIRILLVTGGLAVVIFCLKEEVWQMLLAPSKFDFITYQWIEQFMHRIGFTDFYFEEYHIKLIATDLSSQFMQHLSTALYLGLLGASPYIVWEMFHFVAPALYESEKRYSVVIAIAILALFVIGVLMTYYILFPIAFRFLGTYSVSDTIQSTITLDSYVSTFVTLTLVMGLVFQLPIIAFVLAKMGILHYEFLAHYRKHALIVIMIIAAIITPPDLMTLVLVTIPLYVLYLLSTWLVKKVEQKE